MMKDIMRKSNLYFLKRSFRQRPLSLGSYSLVTGSACLFYFECFNILFFFSVSIKMNLPTNRDVILMLTTSAGSLSASPLSSSTSNFSSCSNASVLFYSNNNKHQAHFTATLHLHSSALISNVKIR